MKKKLMAVVLSAVMAFSMAGVAEASDTEAKDMKIAVVLHAMNSSFYTKLADGARDAGKDFGITVDVTSPTTASNLSEQVSLIESCITADYDGIATVTWDPSGFNSVIQKASDAGIPMVGFNMDAEDCGTKAFIGQEYEDGEIYVWRSYGRKRKVYHRQLRPF